MWENIIRLTNNKSVEVRSDQKSNIIYPLIVKASKRWGAEAYPVVIQDGNIVKAKVYGKDEGKKATNPISAGTQALKDETGKDVYQVKPGAKITKANRRAEFDNYVIMNLISDYDKSMDELLYRLAIYGTFFKKIYRKRGLDKICVDILPPTQVIVNNLALDNRYTTYSQVIELDINEIVGKQHNKVFLNEDLSKDYTTEIEDKPEKPEIGGEYEYIMDTPQRLIEQHRWLDLDQDGFKEPYILVVHEKSRKLLGLYPRFAKDDIEMEDNKVINIKEKNYFIKYDFIPATDGCFYAQGLGDLLYHTNHIINSLLNQLVDAGKLANRSQGFISKFFKERQGNIELGGGEWKVVNSSGINLRDSILPIDHKEPSIVLFNLLQFILQGSLEMVGFGNITGENIASNISPTTIMALVQEGSREFKAIYKRIYRSLTKEIKLIEDAIIEDRDYYVSIYNKILGIEGEDEVNFDEDYNNENYSIVPIADVEIVTNFEKLAKVNFTLTLMQNQVFLPFIDVRYILKNILITMNYSNIHNIITEPPPPQPDPLLQLSQQQQQLEAQRIQIANRDINRKIADDAVKAQKTDYEMKELESRIENVIANSMKTYAETQKIAKETDIMGLQAQMEQLSNKVDALYTPPQAQRQTEQPEQGITPQQIEQQPTLQ
jgi:hypothetical protein